jgi:hypothetical protein
VDGADGGIVEVVRMSRRPPRLWPLAAACAAFLTVTIVFLAASLRANNGQFVFAQDDPYIHLAMARTLANHGVWGLTPAGFAPASSSPPWTALLAALFAVGSRGEWAPFVINVAAGLLLLVVADRELRRTLDDGPRAAALTALVLVTPLPTLMFIGMEHTLQAATTVAFCTLSARRLEQFGTPGLWPGGMLLAAVVGAIRYEGVFVIAVVAGLFVLRGRGRVATGLLASSALGPVLYALFAWTQGGPLLPASVMMKAGAERFGSPAGIVGIVGDWLNLLFLYERPIEASMMLAACLGILALPRQGDNPWRSPVILGGTYLAIAALHVCLLRLDWFYRYDAYLVALGIVAIASMVAQFESADWPWARGVGLRSPVARWAGVACLVLLALPAARRAAEALLTTVRATHEVYLQQYQMGLFFREYYPAGVIAVNDIGAVAWISGAPLVDLIGLASPEVTEARRHDRAGTDFFERIARDRRVSAVCIYEYYFTGPRAVPPSWHKVGEWRIGQHIAVSGDVVGFYAPTAGGASRLRAALDGFAGRLPSDVSYVTSP